MDIIKEAALVLKRDGLVVYPTETVYGLGADALSDNAIYRVYEAKHRPQGQPISVAVSDLDMLEAIGVIDSFADEFIAEFLPGPVTVVLKAKCCLPEVLSGGTGMIGVRYPAHKLAIGLIKEFDSPITATSANQHGAKEPTRPAECHVPYDLLIDGGQLPGTPSTVVDLVNRIVLRPGTNIEEVVQFLSQHRQ